MGGGVWVVGGLIWSGEFYWRRRQRGNEPVAGQHSPNDATAQEPVALTLSTEAMEALQRQADALSTRVTGQEYKYIRIEEEEKRAEKSGGSGRETIVGAEAPELNRQSALDRIRAPDKAYSRADLPRGSAFSRLQGDPRKRKEVKEGKIEYLTPLKTSAGNVFLEIEDRRLLPRPLQQKTS
ncbi:hypothetical protein LIER_14926 [Lithospermum erythrorhizon]|uniref:Uncharacterized protein n=1 Tax=Lithospermum erythrorhizon TaxID=34254 RepID=A0AAV3Q2U1_LITER